MKVISMHCSVRFAESLKKIMQVQSWILGAVQWSLWSSWSIRMSASNHKQASAAFHVWSTSRRRGPRALAACMCRVLVISIPSRLIKLCWIKITKERQGQYLSLYPFTLSFVIPEQTLSHLSKCRSSAQSRWRLVSLILNCDFVKSRHGSILNLIPSLFKLFLILCFNWPYLTHPLWQ